MSEKLPSPSGSRLLLTWLLAESTTSSPTSSSLQRLAGKPRKAKQIFSLRNSSKTERYSTLFFLLFPSSLITLHSQALMESALEPELAEVRTLRLALKREKKYVLNSLVLPTHP